MPPYIWQVPPHPYVAVQSHWASVTQRVTVIPHDGQYAPQFPALSARTPPHRPLR